MVIEIIFVNNSNNKNIGLHSYSKIPFMRSIIHSLNINDQKKEQESITASLTALCYKYKVFQMKLSC